MVGRVALDAADVHRIVHKAPAAGEFAGVFAHIPADRGQRIIVADHTQGIFVLARVHQRDVTRNVDMCRTRALAGNIGVAFGGAEVALGMRAIIPFEGTQAFEYHASCFVADRAIGAVQDSLRRAGNELDRFGGAHAIEHLLLKLDQLRETDAARRAFAARFRKEQAGERLREFDRTLVRWHRNDAPRCLLR